MHETRTLASEETNNGTAVSTGPAPVIPGYELSESIGRGGMGDVYRARDLELDREVAIKILQTRYPVDSSTAERFVAEARITAQLQHPGIPAVYRVSKLADGRPFLAMKLIKGQTLEGLLKSKTPLNQLAIIEAVAQALGYAHAHEVIHRDIKPANIMVGSFGEMQVMDWGLSKVLTQSRERERPEHDPEATTATTLIRTTQDGSSSYTQYGSILGTPAYMPPEQAGGETERVGKASDVFGLGALWCKLLTGQPPIEGDDAEDVRRNAMRGKTEAALARLDGCGAEPEVVALVKQCLAFEPKDRPADGNEVAKRVAAMRVAAEERATQAEVSRARAEVQAAEQAKRRRVMAWSAGAVVGMLLLGLIGTAVGLWYADAARRDADHKRKLAEEAEARESDQRKKAEEETALANGVKDFLQKDVLQLADPATQQQQGSGFKYDADVRLRDVVLRAAEKIEGKFPNRPLVEAEIRYTLGYTLIGMGRADLAAKQYERVLELRRRHIGLDHPDTLKSMHNLAINYTNMGKYTEAIKLQKEALAIQKDKLGSDHPDTLHGMQNLACSYTDMGKYTEAIKLQKEALALKKVKLGPDHPDTLSSLYNLASSYLDMGEYAEALKMCEETLALRKTKLGPDHPDTLKSMHNLATSYAYLGKQVEALKIREEVFAKQKVKLGPGHPDTLSSMHSLATSYQDLGKQTEALKLREETLALRRARLGPDHPGTLNSMDNLASSYQALGKQTEATKLREETLALRKVKLGPDHPDTLTCMYNLASSYQALGKQAEALKLREETLALRRTKLGPDHPSTLDSMNNLANSYSALSKDTEALKLREETLFLRKAKLGFDHPDTLMSMHNLANSYYDMGKHAQALKLREETLVLMKSKLGPEHLHTLWSMNNLATSYAYLGKQVEAMKLHEETLALRKAKLGPGHPDTLKSEWHVIESLMALKRSSEALPRIEALIVLADKTTASGKQPDPQLIPRMFEFRQEIFRKQKDVTGCRTTTEIWEKRNPKTALDLYEAACFRATTAGIQAETKGDDSAAKAKADADQAMVWLTKAVAAGWKDRAHMEKDTDLDYLRSRDDFKKLLGSVPPKK